MPNHLHTLGLVQVQVWYNCYYCGDTVSKTGRGEPSAPWPRRASPGSWWTMEKAFWTVSLRLEAKTEVLGSVDHKLGVVVDEASTGGIALEALSRPDAATCSSTSNRAA